MSKVQQKIIWSVYLEQSERNLEAGHAELLFGLFESEDAARRAMPKIRKKYAQCPGKISLDYFLVGISGMMGEGFFEYSFSETPRKRSPRPNRHKGFKPGDMERLERKRV